jgi:hypothetical protein
VVFLEALITNPKSPPSGSKTSSPYLKGGEFKRDADEANKRTTQAPSLSETDWANLPPKQKEKRQRG